MYNIQPWISVEFYFNSDKVIIWCRIVEAVFFGIFIWIETFNMYIKFNRFIISLTVSRKFGHRIVEMLYVGFTLFGR